MVTRRRSDGLRAPFLAAVTAVVAAAALVWPATAAAAAPPEPDATFLKSSHQSNLAVIELAQDARSKATSGCVRQVAAIMVRDHRKLDAQALPVVGRLAVELPDEPTAAQRRTLTGVQAKAGSARYDLAWLQAQDREHQQLLGLIDGELDRGTNDGAKAVARGDRPVVAMHLNMIRDGRCRIGAAPSRVNAGDGGQAARERGPGALGGAGLVGAGLIGTGLLLVAAAAVVALRRRSPAGPD